jgi:NADH:ubiquinone oxidoreductase subunit 6 (subunit J)
MNLLAVVMYFFAAVTIASAVVIFLSKNIFHAALSLLVCLLCVAALFILNYAEFVGVSQILLYAGGVVVIILFGIMLTNKSGATVIPIGNTNLLSGLVAASAVFFLLIFFVQKSIFLNAKAPLEISSLQSIGIELLTDYVFPFEIAGVLLLAVLVGAAVLAGYKPNNRNT